MKFDKYNQVIQLSKNDLKSRYANSVMGIVWAFALPLVTILVFWYVFQLGFKNLPVGDAPYILWFSAAYIPWVFFNDVIVAGSNSLIEYSFLVKKIKFNVQIIPVIKLLSALFVHLFFLIFLLFMCLIYDYEPDLYNIQVFYYSFATGIFSLGLVWILSAVTVFFKDTASIVNICVQIGFWVTPILWNESSLVDETVKRIISINPMHYIINGYRNSFIFKKWFWESPVETAYFWAITIAIFIIGKQVFKRLQPFFADEV